MGKGEGSGCNLNLTFPKHVTEAEYFRLLDRAVEEISRFQPDFLVLSLGLDTMRGDPLGGACFGEGSYFRMGAKVAALKVPVLVVLEGGYCTEKIGVCAANVAQSLGSDSG